LINHILTVAWKFCRKGKVNLALKPDKLCEKIDIFSEKNHRRHFQLETILIAHRIPQAAKWHGGVHLDFGNY